MDFKRNALKKNVILYNRYMIEDVLGWGGSGLTYLASDLQENTSVAIKECAPYGKSYRNVGAKKIKFLDDAFVETQSELFANEAAILKELSGLTMAVLFKDFFQENDTYYIVMEYFKGITLQEMVNDSNKADSYDFIKVLRTVVECLGFMHERGIIHRDICPENILVSADLELRIIDFGSAVNLNRNNSQNIWNPTYRKGFSPPEQYRMEYEFGAWSDVYSICATIYYCVTKSVPPDAIERMRFTAISNCEVFKRNIWELIEPGMALNYRDRWQETEDILKVLY